MPPIAHPTTEPADESRNYTLAWRTRLTAGPIPWSAKLKTAWPGLQYKTAKNVLIVSPSIPPNLFPQPAR